MASDDLEIAAETVDAPKEDESRHGSRRHDRDRDRSKSEHKRSRSRRNGYDKGDEVEVEGKKERSRRHERDEEVEGEGEREGEREGRSGSRPRRHEREEEDEVERERSRSRSRRHDRDDEVERERSRSRSRRHDRDDEVERERSSKYDREDEVERERSRRSGSRSRRYDREDVEGERSRRSGSRSKKYDREDEVERERPRKYDREDEVEGERSRRSGSRSRKYDRKGEVERESSRRSERDDERSGSRSRKHDKEVEMEMERARSRDRALREKEAEREAREIRKLKEKKEALEPEADPERDQRTVFAYQMPLKATEREVYEFFSQVGKVRDVRLIMDRNSRRSKGVGYIEFYDVASVEAALKLSGQPLLGQPVMVKHSEAEKNLTQSTTGGAGPMGPGAERKLYVGNLHFNMTEDHLRQIFEAFGPVELVQLPLDLETGHCKGFGFVQFAHLEHAKLAQQSLNGTLEIAGRIVKVSNVTEHVPVQDAGANATDFDDDDGGGLALNARSRALLMQKLDRTGTANSIVGSLTVAGSVPLPVNGKAAVSMAQPSLLPAPVVEPIGDPSDCILLKNMFDPSTETEPEFDLDIKDDVQDECSKFGVVRHIFVDKNSKGHVYLRFGSVAAAASCQRAMHMRWFARRCISATFMRPQDYEVKFGKDAF